MEKTNSVLWVGFFGLLLLNPLLVLDTKSDSVQPTTAFSTLQNWIQERTIALNESESVFFAKKTKKIVPDENKAATTKKTVKRKTVIDPPTSVPKLFSPTPSAPLLPDETVIAYPTDIQAGTESAQSNTIIIQALDDTCTGTDATSLQGNIYQRTLTSGEDWYAGNFGQNLTVKVVMVPPPAENYDFEIYDSCTAPVIKRCNLTGSGQIENCSAFVNGDFYVKVVSGNSAYNNSIPYRITASVDGTCSASETAGSASKSSYSCSESVQANNFQYTSNPSGTTQFFVYNELYYPNLDITGSNSQAGLFSSGTGTTTYNTQPFSPNHAQWDYFGNYSIRSLAFAKCLSNNSVTATQAQTPTFPVNSCSCTSHTSFACYGDDVYWFNSCSVREDLKESCNAKDSYGSWEYYCKNSSDLWKKQLFTDYSCNTANNSCALASNNYANDQFAQTCSNGCANNQCNGTPTCTSHASSQCVSNNLYWFSSCGAQEDLKQACSFGCSNNACNPAPTQYPDLTIENTGISVARG